MGVKSKWNDMVECGGIVATSEQCMVAVVDARRKKN